MGNRSKRGQWIVKMVRSGGIKVKVWCPKRKNRKRQ